jgi:hypothetical protein
LGMSTSRGEPSLSTPGQAAHPDPAADSGTCIASRRTAPSRGSRSNDDPSRPELPRQLAGSPPHPRSC